MEMKPSAIQSELKQSQPFRSRTQEATVALLRTADVMRRCLSEAIEPAGITVQQYNVLRILRGAGDKPMATLEIADRLIEEQPGITRLLDRLEDKGLVTRGRCLEDRRQVHVRITDPGRELLDQLDPVVDRAEHDYLDVLSDTELELLLEQLARVRSRAK